MGILPTPQQIRERSYIMINQLAKHGFQECDVNKVINEYVNRNWWKKLGDSCLMIYEYRRTNGEKLYEADIQLSDGQHTFNTLLLNVEDIEDAVNFFTKLWSRMVSNLN